MILLIDSTRGLDLRIGLANGRLRIRRRTYSRPAEAQLLALIDEFLRFMKATRKDLSGIVVATGPGPFSVLRGAAVMANALSFVWRLPAVGVRGSMSMTELLKKGKVALKKAKVGEIVVPHYGRPPNITKLKRA